MARAELPPGLIWIEPLSPHFPHSCNGYAVWETDGTWTWIDPGAAGAENLARTRAELERLGLPLAQLGRIVATHAHVDHLSAAGALAREGVTVPSECHADALGCARDLDTLVASFDFEVALDRFPASEHERSREVLARMRKIIFHGGAPFVPTEPCATLVDGALLETGPFTWRCLHTPGHALGHVMLHEETHGMLVSGDVVGTSLAWHSPTSGGVTEYLRSLERLRDLDLRILLPAHGDPWDEPRTLVDKMRARLLERDRRIVEALEQEGPLAFAELYVRATGDEDRIRLFPYAPMVEGHLRHLAAVGTLAALADGRYERAR